MKEQPLSAEQAAEVDRLVSRLIDGLLTDEECSRLDDLLSSSADAVRRYRELLDNHEALCTIYPGDVYESLNAANTTDEERAAATGESSGKSPQPRLTRLTIVACLTGIAVMLVAAFFESMFRPDEKPIATVTELSGAHIWTGDRGEMVRKIVVGSQLTGGTIEGMAPDSWFELQFNDGSKVVIAGISMLTFSDNGQKILRLREGQLTADVQPQPAGHPMLLHTRTAIIEVLGTQFDVQSALSSTVLNVSEGSVRLRRLSDGREVDVPAEHRVIADDESHLIPEKVPHSVHEWVSDFNLRSGYYGKWKPASGDRPASVKAIPLVPTDAPHVTLHLASVPVRQTDGSRVVVQPGSRFVVRGRLEQAVPVYFGIRVHYPNGEFAGMFRGDLQGQQTPARPDSAGNFAETYELDQFSVDPVVWDRRHELAPRPDQLVLDGVWVFTHSDDPSGLEVTEVNLLPPMAR